MHKKCSMRAKFQSGNFKGKSQLLDLSVDGKLILQFALNSGMFFVCFPGVTIHCVCIFHSPVAGFSLFVFAVSGSNTTTRHIRQDSSGRVINPSQRPLPNNTQHSHQTNIHAPGGIRTHDRSRRAAEDLHIRPHCHWDRQYMFNTSRHIQLVF